MRGDSFFTSPFLECGQLIRRSSYFVAPNRHRRPVTIPVWTPLLLLDFWRLDGIPIPVHKVHSVHVVHVGPIHSLLRIRFSATTDPRNRIPEWQPGWGFSVVTDRRIVNEPPAGTETGWVDGMDFMDFMDGD